MSWRQYCLEIKNSIFWTWKFIVDIKIKAETEVIIDDILELQIIILHIQNCCVRNWRQYSLEIKSFGIEDSYVPP